MTIFMYQASVPVCVRMLGNLRSMLEKAVVHAGQKNFDPDIFVSARLFPDMYPLAKQVQIASDIAKGAVARLTGQEPPRYEDTETSLADLLARIAKTIEYIGTCQEVQFEGSDRRPITLVVGGNTLQFEGLPYLLNFVHPNLYFHIATTYAILRHWGVELGKLDFLGKP